MSDMRNCSSDGEARRASSKRIPTVPKRILNALPTIVTVWLGVSIRSSGGSWHTRSDLLPLSCSSLMIRSYLGVRDQSKNTRVDQ
jgi:hypothetical protein